MMKQLLLTAAVATTLALSAGQQAEARHPLFRPRVTPAQVASTYAWHGDYYNMQYRAPVALVVPPTAHMHTQYSWGASQNLMYPIHHQFQYGAPGPGNAGLGAFRATPPWPSHTDQFGVYYVRGPW